MKDKGVLEVEAFYGKESMYKLYRNNVTDENIHLELNEIFMKSQNVLDSCWLKVMDQMKLSNTRNELLIKVKYDGMWLFKTLSPKAQLRFLPQEHESVSTVILRSLDQLKQGKTLDSNIVPIYEDGKFD